MTKKGKKGPQQKRGKASGKSAKKITEQPDAEQPSTSSQAYAESAPPPLPPRAGSSRSASGIIPPTKPPVTALDPITGTIKRQCKALEMVATNIQHEKELPDYREHRQQSVDELQYLVTEIQKLAHGVGFRLEGVPPLPPRPSELTEPLVFYEEEFKRKWPKFKTRVPHIFLHQPNAFWALAREILSRNIKIYWPSIGSFHAKILPLTFEDHENLVKFLDEKEMPYHTFGYPFKKPVKVVIRGISNDADLNKVKEEMIKESIPVESFHEINAKSGGKAKYKTVLIVVPNTPEGKKVIKLKTVFGQYVSVDAPWPRCQQCHRCQKWGHTQRNCRGQVRCVKCAEQHFSSECTRDPAKEPFKCVNCLGEHVASYRRCPHCPNSREYRIAQSKKLPKQKELKVLTHESIIAALGVPTLNVTKIEDDVERD